MSKLGLNVWLKKAYEWAESREFLYKDLPGDLKNRSDIGKAVSKGYVQRVGQVNTQYSSRLNVYQMTKKTQEKFA